MKAKKKEKRKPKNITILPSVEKIGIALAIKRKVSFSQLIEIMIYDYNAE